jgi:hypothetical protein
MAITWNAERMATGVDEVDEQHQELIRHFNDGHGSREGRADARRLDPESHLLGRHPASRLCEARSLNAKLHA